MDKECADLFYNGYYSAIKNKDEIGLICDNTDGTGGDPARWIKSEKWKPEDFIPTRKIKKKANGKTNPTQTQPYP